MTRFAASMMTVVFVLTFVSLYIAYHNINSSTEFKFRNASTSATRPAEIQYSARNRSKIQVFVRTTTPHSSTIESKVTRITPTSIRPTPTSIRPTLTSIRPSLTSIKPTPNSIRPTPTLRKPTSTSIRPTPTLSKPTSTSNTPASPKKKENVTATRLKFLNAAMGTKMTKSQRLLYVETLVAFDKLWRQTLGFDYQLYGGALLGAYRHSGMIPYDDDVDIILPATFRDKFDVFFANSGMSVKRQGLWKGKVFFSNNRTLMTRYGWKWPFLDVFFQVRDGGQLKDPTTPSYTLSVSDVYPNIRILFEGHYFPAPRCIDRVLTKLYGTDFMRECCTTSYNHKLEGYHMDSVCMSCDALKRYFTVNSWRRIDNLFAETKMAKIVNSSDKHSTSRTLRIYMPKCN